MKKTYKKLFYTGLFALLIFPTSFAFATLYFHAPGPGPTFYQADDFDSYRPQAYWDNIHEQKVYPWSRRFCQTYITYGHYCINTTRCYKTKGHPRACYYYRDCRNRPYYETSCHHTRLFGE